jgi:hypothetical protein
MQERVPTLSVQIQISDNSYPPNDDEETTITISTTLKSNFPITIHNQGKWNSELGTALYDDFRLYLFNWFDVTADEDTHLDEHNDQPWGCTTGIFKDHCLELKPGEPFVTEHAMDDGCPLTDPLVYAMKRKGHRFRLELKGQTLKWTDKSKEELFRDGKTEISYGEYEMWGTIELGSEDVIEFTIT